MSIRVFIVDDHPLLVQGLVQLISSQSDMEVVGHAADVRSAVEQIGRLRPDVALVDLVLLDGSGIEVIRRARDMDKFIRLVALTGLDDEESRPMVAAAGGDGYLSKTVPPGEIVETLRMVLQSHRAFVSAPGVEYASVEAGHGNAKPSDGLSRRELQVMEFLVRGYTNIQIAERLLIGEKTVATYRSRLMKKLRLRSRSDLVRWAMGSARFSEVAF